MPCMCGDSQCPSCGFAQGTLETIALRCPKCGEDTTAELIPGFIMATPSEPTIECDCGALWRIELHEVVGTDTEGGR